MGRMWSSSGFSTTLSTRTDGGRGEDEVASFWTWSEWRVEKGGFLSFSVEVLNRFIFLIMMMMPMTMMMLLMMTMMMADAHVLKNRQRGSMYREMSTGSRKKNV